ncbi:MAG: dihydropteroate synthase [Bacteroidia bacterium]|nr:dihydropteroate synthase [Bacteroidia bacterium]
MEKTYTINGKQLTFNKAQVMAIINLTPDSFYDGGRFSSISDIVKDVEHKINEGATIIDLGAASSRENAAPLAVKDEILRLGEPLRRIRNEFPQIFLSVDTYLSEVAEFAISEGVDIINDISGGKLDENMLQVVVKQQVVYVLMHMQGTPQNMQHNPQYDDVTKTILNFFKERIAYFKSNNFDKLILDVGFGFGKTVEHNYELLKHISDFTNLEFPVLAGLSRKSMINKVINTMPTTALNGTTALNMLALQNGAKILRVHDVKEAKQVVDLFEFYKNV